MKPHIGIEDENRKGVVQILNQLLADEYLLYTKTRNFHWNVTGPDFSQLHKFFESQYEELDEIIDEVAERTRSLGEKPVATLKEFLQQARLKQCKRQAGVCVLTRHIVCSLPRGTPHRRVSSTIISRHRFW